MERLIMSGKCPNCGRNEFQWSSTSLCYECKSCNHKLLPDDMMHLVEQCQSDCKKISTCCFYEELPEEIEGDNIMKPIEEMSSDELIALLYRFPRTSDGITVFPGMEVFYCTSEDKVVSFVVDGVENWGGKGETKILRSYSCSGGWTVDPDECYSMMAMAITAKNQRNKLKKCVKDQDTVVEPKNIKKIFYQGQQLRAISFFDNSSIRVKHKSVLSIEIVMENGQMDGVPWCLVSYEDGKQVKYNLALLKSVRL